MKELIITLPGNPSIPGLYDDFISSVIKELPSCEQRISTTLSHLGQCNSKRYKRRKITVLDVIEDHKNSILDLIDFHKADNVIIIGHSLGCAITFALYKDLGQKVNQFIMLCPFIGPTQGNTNFLRVFQNPITRKGIKSLTHILLFNKNVSKKIITKLLGENPLNERITREIKKPLYLRNFLTLLSNYLKDFKKLNIAEDLKEMDPKKAFFLFVPNDYWVPDEVVKLLPTNAQYTICDKAEHDFCLYEEQYKVVANIIGQFIKENPPA
jgi:pimeloyl-ACP methyl ester carboxylesterase